MNITSKCKSCGPYYLAGLLLIWVIKSFYSNAGSDDLIWMLAPTTWWASILGGITFEYETHIGYINHDLRFIIAPSCSGVQFMMITMTVLIFSFIHLMDNHRKRLLWFCSSLALSWPLTVFINGIRIVLSIYLPGLMSDSILRQYDITLEKLHSIIGTAVYFSALLLIYLAAGRIIKVFYMTSTTNSSPFVLKKLMAPVFWYFFIVLGLPFLNRAYHNNLNGFFAYAILITAVSMTILGSIRIIVVISYKFRQNC